LIPLARDGIEGVARDVADVSGATRTVASRPGFKATRDIGLAIPTAHRRQGAERALPIVC